MSRPFVPGGPPRYVHQKRGLRRLVRQRGVGALLMDPGTGKTATTIDFLSVLALKRESEVRVLVVCPLAATDTWVTQMGKWASPDVNFWAEVLGGSMVEKAEALAARGGEPFKKPFKRKAYQRQPRGTTRRALHHRKAIAWDSRPKSLPAFGPEELPEPRIVLEVINLDVLGRRDGVGSRTQADVFVEAIKRFAPDVVVLDESHKAKSASSNVSRFMARLTKIVQMRIILTGTVMPNGPLDVFGQWRFLDPYAFSPTEPDGSKREMTFARFKDRYAVMGGYMGKEVVGYCNTPDAPIWMRDGTFKAIGEVKPGDLVMGWDQEATAHVKGGARRTLAESEVLSVHRRIAQNVVEVTLSSGQKITCTADHPWLRYNTKDREDKWVTVTDRPYHRNRGFSIGLSRVVNVPEKLDAVRQRSADWLAGMYDGEGSGTSIYQSGSHNPDVCRRIEKELSALGIPYGVTYSDGEIDAYRFKGGQQTYVDILNQWPITRKRFLEDLIQWSRSARYKSKVEEPKRMHRQREFVVSVRELPPQEVVSMQTTTGNYVAWGLASKNCNIDELQKIMAEKAIVVRKEDALDLPKTTDVDLPVHLSAREKKAYADMVKDLTTDLTPDVTSTTSSSLTQMMRLRQITSGHLPDDSGQVQRIGHSKVDTIKSLVQDTLAGEKRVVIFALFTEEIHMLEEALSGEKGAEVLVISGATPKPERRELRKRFGSDNPARMVLIAQIKTLSLAVNELVTANHAIFASLSQQRDDLIQGRDRLNRIGQERPVTFWYAVAPGTIDEVILRSHRERTDLESSVLEHVQSYDG